jgi:hypothetical protein
MYQFLQSRGHHRILKDSSDEGLWEISPKFGPREALVHFLLLSLAAATEFMERFMRPLQQYSTWKYLLALLVFCLFPIPLIAAGPAYIDPEKTDDDFPYQGEYVGVIETDDGDRKIAVQVIAMGRGNFEAVAYEGGLPGDGWDRDEPLRVQGRRDGERVVFDSEEGRGILRRGVMVVVGPGGDELGELRRVERKSPTLGKEPPEGAVVLFDGSGTENWRRGRMSDEGWLIQGTTSIPTFQSHQLHLEFLLPYQPEDRGQGRGNSGVYLQGRYEVQVLDSFGLEGKDNECGGIYSVKAPDLNMCFPPLRWQTYDIDYTAARFDDQGLLVAAPRMTVKHNGVVIHDDVELPGDRNTTAAPLPPGPEPGPVYLQDHGNPVRFRNIWVVPKD